MSDAGRVAGRMESMQVSEQEESFLLGWLTDAAPDLVGVALDALAERRKAASQPEEG